MSDNQEDRKWSIKREISLGDVVSIVTAAVLVVISYMQLNARVQVVEVLTSQNSAQINSTVAEIKSDMRRLADRVERIVDTNHTNGLRR